MAPKANKGGKLNRSQAVSVRLDPKLKHAAEMAARHQRRTLSSFIEWAVEQSLNQYYLDEKTSFDKVGKLTFDVREPETLLNIAMKFPNLLNFDEMVIWKEIESHIYFWHCEQFKGSENIYKGKKLYELIKNNVIEQWDNILQIVDGGEDKIPNKPGRLEKLEETYAEYNKIPF